MTLPAAARLLAIPPVAITTSLRGRSRDRQDWGAAAFPNLDAGASLRDAGGMDIRWPRAGAAAAWLAVVLAAALAGPAGAVEPNGVPPVPADLAALVREANSLFAQGRSADAEVRYAQLLSLHPTNAYLLSNLGVVRFQLGRLDDAEADLRRAVGINPAEPFAAANLGILLCVRARYTDAVPVLERAASLDVRDLRTRHYLALAYRCLGRTADAIREWEQVLALDPAHAEARRGLDALRNPPPAATPTPARPATGAVTACEANPATVIVLGYHQFDSPVPNEYSIRTERFRGQMQWLRDNGWTVVPLQSLIAFLQGRTNLPPKSAVITIDDGYRSVYLRAFPVLREYGYPWTFFCYTDFIQSGAGAVTWAQLREMRAAGCDVQSHTKSHPVLPKRGGKSEAQYLAWLDEELAGSRKILEANLGARVNALAYSYGEWNETVRQRALAAGYEALFTVAGAPIHRATSIHAIGRYVISGANEDKFASYLVPFKPVLSLTVPADLDSVAAPLQRLEARLHPAAGIDPATVTASLEPARPVHTRIDPASQLAVIESAEPLQPGKYRVHIRGVEAASGRTRSASWSFNVLSAAQPSGGHP